MFYSRILFHSSLFCISFIPVPYAEMHLGKENITYLNLYILFLPFHLMTGTVLFLKLLLLVIFTH